MPVFFSTIALVITIGALLDRIISIESKKAIATYLHKKATHQSFSERLHETITSIKPLIFDRIFSARAFSLKFLFRSSILSIIIFLSVMALYSHGSTDFFVRHKLWTGPFGAAALALSVILNLAIDYLSSAQTGFFLGLGSNTKRVGEIAIIYAADLLVTTALFVILFAFVLAVTAPISMLDAHPTELAIQLPRQDKKRSIDDKEWEALFKPNLGLSIMPPELQSQLTAPKYAGIATITMKDDIRSGYQVYTAIFATDPQDIKAIKKAIDFLVARSRLVSGHTKVNHNEELKYAIKFSLRNVELDVPYLYAASYLSANAIQTQFWGVFKGHIISASYDRLIKDYDVYISGLRATNGQIEGVCLDSSQPRALQKLDTSCAKWVALADPLDGLLFTAGATAIDTNVIPLSAFFISSLSMTVAIYAAIFIFILGRASWLLWVKLGSSRLVNIDDYPFSFVSVPTAVALGSALAFLWVR
ncbi:hypothetical protein [Hyphomicrobium sp. NDB2Meth4]|uniref:hypothetical protein n=1 Tax=Hyphomicrobium sp. NDB2Meth4 TaxID=1892846 RepID=UPI0009312BA8|nr:hypothetical protein [Hyphomicrobium sp. NDB2Meth4]